MVCVAAPMSAPHPTEENAGEVEKGRNAYEQGMRKARVSSERKKAHEETGRRGKEECQDRPMRRGERGKKEKKRKDRKERKPI